MGMLLDRIWMHIIFKIVRGNLFFTNYLLIENPVSVNNLKMISKKVSEKQRLGPFQTLQNGSNFEILRYIINLFF